MTCIADDEAEEDIECYLGIGTTDFSIVLLKVLRNGTAEKLF